MAGTLQGDGVGERLSDRQSGSQQGAVAAESGTRVVVSVLLRDRARRSGLRRESSRLQQADLAYRVAQMEFRRRDVRALGGIVRQSGSRRDRDSQLPLASRTRAGRTAIRRSGKASREGADYLRADHHDGRRRHGAPHPEPSAYAKKFTGKYAHRNVGGGTGHNLPQEAPKAFADAVIDVARF